MQSSVQSTTETEQYFQQAELDKDDTKESYQYILSTIDDALNSQNHEMLIELISYIESGKGHLAFQYIGKTRQILRILHIIELEQKYQKIMFSFDCQNVETLLEKYMLTLFAFRRLLFQLSADSVAEAICYLRNNPISHLAAYIIAQDELIIPTDEFYETLASSLADYWTAEDMIQFFTLTSGSPATS